MIFVSLELQNVHSRDFYYLIVAQAQESKSSNSFDSLMKIHFLECGKLIVQNVLFVISSIIGIS